MATSRPVRIGILVFDDAEELDVVGPYEVLTAWAALSPLRPEVVLFSPDGAGVRLAKGLMASVCTGALVYAAAGLLAGRPATTHHSAFDELVSIDPSVLLDTEARFVDDGDVVTSAGVSAGIDMALHLVERLESPHAAEAVRHEIQYERPYRR